MLDRIDSICDWIPVSHFIYLFSLTFQQKGTFETGQEDSTDIPEELKLRLAYREAAVAVLACHLPDPYCPIIEVAMIVHDCSSAVPFCFLWYCNVFMYLYMC